MKAIVGGLEVTPPSGNVYLPISNQYVNQLEPPVVKRLKSPDDKVCPPFLTIPAAAAPS